MAGAPATIEGLRAERASEHISTIVCEAHELEHIFHEKPVGIPCFSLVSLKEAHAKLAELIERADANAAEFDALVEKWRAES